MPEVKDKVKGLISNPTEERLTGETYTLPYAVCYPKSMYSEESARDKAKEKKAVRFEDAGSEWRAYFVQPSDMRKLTEKGIPYEFQRVTEAGYSMIWIKVPKEHAEEAQKILYGGRKIAVPVSESITEGITHISARPVKITDEVRADIMRYSDKGYTPNQIKALIKEKYGIDVGESTIWQIKRGVYPEPKGASSVSTSDIEEDIEEVEREIEEVEDEIESVEKQIEVTYGEMMGSVKENVAESLATVIKEDESKGGVMGLKVTQTPEWRAAYEKAREIASSPQEALRLAWQIYRGEVGEQVGARAKKKAKKEGYTERGKEISDVYKKAVKGVIESLKAETKAAATKVLSEFSDALKEMVKAGSKVREFYLRRPDMAEKVKEELSKAWDEALANVKSELKKLGPDLRKAMKKAWTEAMTEKWKEAWESAFKESGYAEALRKPWEEKGPLAPLKEEMGKAYSEFWGARTPVSSYVGQIPFPAAIQLPTFKETLTEIGGKAAGAIGGLLANKLVDKLLARLAGKWSRIVSAVLTYAGIWGLHAYLRRTGVVGGFAEEALEAARTASAIWLISGFEIGGVRPISVDENITSIGAILPEEEETSAYIPEEEETEALPEEEYVPSEMIGQGEEEEEEIVLTPEEEEEIMERVASVIGYRPDTVDLEVNPDGTVDAIVDGRRIRIGVVE